MGMLQSRLPRLAVSAALVLAVASTASAQQGRRPGGGGFGGFGGFGGDKVSLAGNSQVQSELKVSDEQKKKIEEVTSAYREESRKLFSGFQDLSREERTKKFEENRPAREKLTADAEAKIDGILAADQKERLDEISVRLAGTSALRQDKVATKLGLTDDQKTKIKGILDDQDKKRRELFQPAAGGGRPDFAGMREKMDTLRKETTDQVNAVLTSEQKTKWDTLKGEPFELRRPEGRGPGGGGNRRNRGTNN